MNWIKLCLVSGLTFAATQVSSEQITIETNDGVHLIRCIDQFGFARCEMIFESEAEYCNCIAFDADGAPLATSIGSGSFVRFADLDASLVADVRCR